MLRRRQRRDLLGRAGADLAGVALHVDDALGILGKGQVLRGQRLHASSAMKPMGKSVKKNRGFTWFYHEIGRNSGLWAAKHDVFYNFPTISWCFPPTSGAERPMRDRNRRFKKLSMKAPGVN